VVGHAAIGDAWQTRERMTKDLEQTLTRRARARGTVLAIWGLRDGRVEAGFVVLNPGHSEAANRLSVAAGDRKAALEGLQRPTPKYRAEYC
jgi:hypothetical protein